MTAVDVPGGQDGRDLYGIPPDEFTAARNALARQLRAAGDKAAAALVAKLRRPPATAWALNKVARERPAVIGAIVDAGETLRAATERALAGDASSLRAAQAVERQAVEGATTAAAAYLSEAGLGAGDGPLQRMASTLRASMIDEMVAAALREGVLDDDRDAPGFGLDAFSAAAAGSATRRRAPARPRVTTAAGVDGAEAARSPAGATTALGAGAGAEPRAAASNEVAKAGAGAVTEVGTPAGGSTAGGTSGPADAQTGDTPGTDRPADAEAALAAAGAAAKAAEAADARERAEHLKAAATAAERDAQRARDAASAARTEAEVATARAWRVAAAADAATAAAMEARKDADHAVARAERALRPPTRTDGAERALRTTDPD